MEIAAPWLGAFLIVDLLALCALMAFVAVIARRSKQRAPLTAMFGMLIFVAIGSLLMYGGLWLALHFAA